MTDQQIKLSIIICTYNRATFLAGAIDALLHQTIGLNSCEVIIVNNNSTDETQAVAEKIVSTHPHFRAVFEKRQGLSYARNRGYKEAVADWVAYLDDDAKTSVNYVERILHVIDHYGFDCFGGVYLPWYKYGKPKWFKDSYASNGFKLQKTGILDGDYASGGIIVFKKSVLEHFNGFPVSIGMKGEKIAYGEETLLQVRMRKEGYRIGFDPHLQIEHVVSPNKLSSVWFVRSSFAVGRDYWDAFDLKVEKKYIFMTITSGIYYFSLALYKSTPQLLKHDYFIQNWFIDVFRPLAMACGKISRFLRA